MTPLSIPLLSKKQKLQFLLALVSVLAATINFLRWWIDPAHHISYLFSIAVGYIICYQLFSPFWFYYFAYRSVKPNTEKLPTPPGRIAMVVAKAPSEPWDRVKLTIQGCLSQQIPYDTMRTFDVWLADEDPQPETLQWCRENGVRVSSRRNHALYHNPVWPRRTKCKEGNLAYFYDHKAYHYYDFVLQLDSDHIPQERYLAEMMAPFNDPQVGYVAAPSICDVGSEKSWFSRGRLYAEAALHGVQQAGHSNGFAPLAIGSHYAVRTQALQQIGGLGPELAEDHSTSLLMNAGGWKGAFSINAIAHGDGPSTFVDGITQEFQWSRSLGILLFTELPKCISKLRFGIAVQFLYSELWYPMFTAVTMIGYILLWVALATDVPVMNVNFLSFTGLSFAHMITTLVPIWLLRKWRVLRPYNAPIISWEEPLYQIARLPWIVFGLVSAAHTLLKKNKAQQWKVTPKGGQTNLNLPHRVVVPYVVLAVITFVIVLITHDVENTAGYHVLSIIAGMWSLFTVVAIVLLHPKKHLSHMASVFATLVLLVVTSVQRLPAGIGALAESFQPLVEEKLVKK